MIISRGKLVACDTSENLQKRFAGRISMELTVEAENIRAKNILSSVSRITGSTVLSEENNVSRLALETEGLADADLCREIFFAFAKENVAILEMKTIRATLEDIFIELTGKGAQK